MKKTLQIIAIVLLSLAIFLLGFKQTKNTTPKIYYKVYLDQEELGIIKSKESLEKYIDKQGTFYKEKYGVNKVYIPNGLEIEKYITYNPKTKSIKNIYNEIINKKPLTIKAYEINFYKHQVETEVEEATEIEVQKINVIKRQTMDQALEKYQTIFIGEEIYKAFKDNTQKTIENTGNIIEDIYIEENKTIKETNIPVNALIFSETDDLTQYLLFGENKEVKDYTVKIGDTIESISFEHEINPEEFLISNNEFSSQSSLLYPGQKVKVRATSPQIKVVKKEYVVKDVVNNYKTEVRYDSTVQLDKMKQPKKE